MRASEAAGITPDAMKLEVERARKRARYKEKREQERRDLNPAASAQPRERSTAIQTFARRSPKKACCGF